MPVHEPVDFEAFGTVKRGVDIEIGDALVPVRHSRRPAITEAHQFRVLIECIAYRFHEHPATTAGPDDGIPLAKHD